MEGDVQCVRIRLKPGSRSRVHEWAATINDRQSEALATLADEGVEIESVFLDATDEGDFLVYYLRARSLEEPHRVVAESRHDIDAYHQQFKRDCWASTRELELLVDLVSRD